MRIVFTLFLWIVVTFAFGQNNPFDIASKKTKSFPSVEKEETSLQRVDVQADTLIKDDSVSQENSLHSNNVFDIGTDQPISLTAPDRSDTVSPDISSPKITTPISSDNPFEITEKTKTEQVETLEATKDIPKRDEVHTDVIRKTQSINSDKGTFIFWLSLLTIIVIALNTTLYNNTIRKLFRGMANDNMLSLNQRNENGGLSVPYLSLYLVAILEIAIFIYLLYSHFAGVNGWFVFLKVFAIILGLIFLKHVLVWAIGNIFKISSLTSFYNFRIQSYQILLGLFLIPVALLIHYSPEAISHISIYIGIIACLIVLLLLYAKSTLSALSALKGNLFHFLLYLCTFEIIPLLIMAKLIVS